jgi:hypothetical protein
MDINQHNEEVLSELLKATKPHMIVVEQELLQVPFGTVTATYTMRAGKVVKVDVITSKTWLADKT